MGWIAKSKLHDPKTKRWYCLCCDARKPIEINPDWEFNGRPQQWLEPCRYDWFARCSECHHQMYSSSYSCDECGADNADAEPLQITNYSYNYGASMEFGSCYDWDEKHRCRKCRHIYWIRNGNC